MSCRCHVGGVAQGGGAGQVRSGREGEFCGKALRAFCNIKSRDIKAGDKMLQKSAQGEGK